MITTMQHDPYDKQEIVEVAEEIKKAVTPSILLEAQGLVHGDRQAAYSHPIDDFTRTAKMWSAIKGVQFTPQEVALFLICVKLSRLAHSPHHHDSQVDIAGYIETYFMVEEAIAGRKAN